MMISTRLVPRLVFLVAMLAATQAVAQHRLSSGDAVEITVFRMPELSREARVDIDGHIAVPPLGNIEAEDLTVVELEDRIRDRLIEAGIVDEALVTVALASVRDVVVGGDVAEPGAVAFSFGLTVQQAVALAGGIGRQRQAAPDEMARLGGEAANAAAELLRERARLARIEAELSGEELVEARVVAPTAPKLRDEILRLARETVMANRAEAREEQEYLKRTRELVAARIAELDASRKRYDERIAQQREQVNRLGSVQDRGLVLQDRVTQENRALADLVEEASDIDTARLSSQQRHVELGHEIDRYEARRRAALTTERQAALISVAALEARLEALRGQLVAFGDIGDATKVRIAVYRQREGASVEIPADAGSKLEPGDFVQVQLILSDLAPRSDL